MNVLLDIIKKNPNILKELDETHQILEICMEAVKHDGLALRYVKEQTVEICMEAVKHDGDALLYVKSQSPAICMEAVKQNSKALIYVVSQSPEICMEAVKQTGSALRYVKNQTPELCMEAVKRSGSALQYVKNQTPELCECAINQDGLAIQYVQEPTLDLYKLSYKISKKDMLIYVNYDKFDIEDIIGDVETKYVEVIIDVANKIVFRDSLTGKFRYVNKLVNIEISIIEHIKSQYGIVIDDVKFIINDKKQDVNTLLITPIESAVETSLHVVQNDDIYELYKKYSELVETGYFMSNKVYKPALIKLGEYFDPQL